MLEDLPGMFDPTMGEMPEAPSGSDLMSYIGCCNDLYLEAPSAFTDMQDNGDEITAEEFEELCYGLDIFNTQRGYGDCPGLSIKTDYAVRFYKSTYRGEPCCYLTWSGYEYVWQ